MKILSRPKATIEELTESYRKLGSVWKVGEKFNLCGQTVHERLKKANIKLKGSKFTQRELGLIREFYGMPFKRGESNVRGLSIHLGRCYHSIVRKAREMGLTSQSRTWSDDLIDQNSVRAKKWHQENEHPKGMTGKTHSVENRKKISRCMKDRWKNMTDEEIYQNRKLAMRTQRANGNDKKKHGSWKAAWREIGGKKKYFRSRWEANYARYLEYLKSQKIIEDWLHEPQTFWFDKIKRGCVSYLPDYKVIMPDGSHYWVEVKGYMDDRSKIKIKRFEKYFPNETLKLIDGSWFKKNGNKLKMVCANWE